MRKYRVESWSDYKKDAARTHGWRSVKDKQSGKATWIWKRRWVHRFFHEDVDACLGDHS